MNRALYIGKLVFLPLVFLVLFIEQSQAERTVSISAPGGGQVRALLVGINQYSSPSIPTLKGAVADALDLERTLKAAGVTDLTTLVEAGATRKNFVSAIGQLIESSRTGDLVIISLAGHGSQQPELVKGSESDGMDEIFLLSGFSWTGSGTSERIVDNEINAWLFQLDAKGVDVLLVADTCHGGGLSRQPDFRADDLSYRVSLRPTISLVGDELKPISTDKDAFLTAVDMPKVTFLAAVDKFTKAPEVIIPGIPTKRGALSYAVARSIDRGADGIVTRNKLFGLARQLAYQYSLTQQTIATEPSGKSANLEKPVFALKFSGEVELPAMAAISIRIRVPQASMGLLASVSPGSFRFTIVGDGETADLRWDPAKGEILNPYGDIVADCSMATLVPAIADRTGAIFSIARIAEHLPQKIRLTPSDGRFRKGDTVAFRIEGLSGKYLMLVGLSGDGTVKLLFPSLKSDVALMQTDSFNLPLRVSEPFGADDIVALVSDRRLPALEASIHAITDRKAAGDFLNLITETIRSNETIRIGSAALFTGK